MNSSPAKYDMRANPAYQVDWSCASSGKRVAATKRRATFRFGFSNRSALEKGLSGTEVRGEEHEATLIWSLTSNKRKVFFDGNEVHFSTGRRGDAKFETSWPIGGGHILKIVAYATTPLRPTPGFKQFDLFLDGMSFFCLPRIYELGIRRGVARAVQPLTHEHAFAYNNRCTEEDWHHNGVMNHRYDAGHSSRRQAFDGSARRTTLEAMPSNDKPLSTPPVQVAPVEDVLSAQPAVSDFLESTPPATFAVDEFTPVQVQPSPPTFQDVSSQILSAYNPVASAPAPINSQAQTLALPQSVYTINTACNQQVQTYQPQPATVSPSATSPCYYSQQLPSMSPQSVMDPSVAQVPVVTPTMMKPLDVEELRDSPPPLDAMDQAVQNLVNLNDLKETRATPEQLKAKKQKELNKSQERKSQPKAPAATDWHVGANASLADIQKHKKPVASSTKEIMKVHAFDPAAAQAGMMVVYGQQQPQAGYGGSIPPAMGFGVGRAYYRH